MILENLNLVALGRELHRAMGPRRDRDLDPDVGMSRYGLGWLEIAREHYASLPAPIREQIGLRIKQLLENPRHAARSSYDEATDQWTTTYGGGAELIVHAVVKLRTWPRTHQERPPAAIVAAAQGEHDIFLISLTSTAPPSLARLAAGPTLSPTGATGGARQRRNHRDNSGQRLTH
ncbi:MAG: hypothetical protein LC808_32400 [Actinobacteria bacterium]|nr:hypothetical protein [Actinomycetota bacterium]